MQSTPVEQHSRLEDGLAIIWGTAFVSLGLALYQKAMLMVGSLAGVALLLNYTTGWAFGLVFFVINLPFWYLAIKRMGWAFTIRTFIAVVLFSVLSRYTPTWVEVARIEPVYAAIIGGGLMGTGLLILFRHRAALGGLQVLALYLQDNHGIRAGYFTLGVDLVILVAAFLVLDWQQVLLSILGAAALNLTVAINHRKGRYVGIS